MDRKLIRFFAILLTLITLSVVALNLSLPKQPSTPTITTTNFITYDLARAVTGNADSLKMLLPPGSEPHDFEPTPSDIIAIEQSDLFIYIGGESDSWVETLLKNNELSPEKTLRLIDFVDLKAESAELESGHDTHNDHDDHDNHANHDDHDNPDTTQDHDDYDEHIWTNPLNAIKMIQAIEAKLTSIEPTNAETYRQNTASYISSLEDLDKEFRNLISTSPKNTLLFADRFPFRYFVDEYGLDYLAAFPGCSDQTEASSATIARLIDYIKSNGLKVILKTELTSGKLAKSISDETGTKILILSAGHNISQSDFDSGITYLDILRQDLNTLREALQ